VDCVLMQGAVRTECFLVFSAVKSLERNSVTVVVIVCDLFNDVLSGNQAI
jgi:hypothetical protein